MLLIVAVVAPLLHKYVKPGVPPDGVLTIDPLVNPHVSSVVVKVTVGAADDVMSNDCNKLQPDASVTVSEYVPAARLLMLSLVELSFHRYVYGDVPPVTLVMSIEPFVCVQVAFTTVA
jgi:hypothetical protein